MERKQGESYKSFLTRVVDAKKNNRITYEEMGNSIVDDNRWSSENFRKFFYIIQPVLEKLNEDANITDNEILQDIEIAKQELYKEKVKVRDQKRELNKMLTQEARFENLREVMCERLDDLGYLPQNRANTYKSNKVIGAALLISDVHAGIKIDNQFNYYDIDVCEDRLNQLVDKTMEYCKLHNVNKLNIELLGDLISGLIQHTCRIEQEEDVISQIIIVSDLLSECVNKLAENIDTVTVYCVNGNHSRLHANKKESINRENFERLICEFIRRRVKNVRVVDGMGEDFIKYEDFGRTFVLTHGHNDNVTSVVNNFTQMLKCNIDSIHMGHFHNYRETNEQDINVVVNGSVVGSDDYSLSIRKNSRPMQVLKVYGENDECTYKIYLK